MKNDAIQDHFNFDRNKSVLKAVYEEFSCYDPYELDELYTAEDQRLMYADAWDYKNENLLPNKIKSAIERVGVDTIPDPKEKFLIRNILWLWYHHAISSAMEHYADKDAALELSARALAVQPKGHPNMITRLLYLLIRDRLEEAEAWRATITTEPEKSTAHSVMEQYKS